MRANVGNGIERGFRNVRGAVAAALGLVCCAPATQAVAEEGAGGLEEIVVTATRRVTNLQNVGIAISAFSGDELATQGVSMTTDLVAVTPCLQFSEPGGSPVAGVLAIRGVYQNAIAGHIGPANAF